MIESLLLDYVKRLEEKGYKNGRLEGIPFRSSLLSVCVSPGDFSVLEMVNPPSQTAPPTLSLRRPQSGCTLSLPSTMTGTP